MKLPNFSALSLLISLLLFGCQTETPKEATNTDQEAGSAIQEPAPTITTIELDTLAELQSLTPEGYEILGHRYGDLNKDDQTNDLILVLKATGEAENSDMDNPSPRPVKVYTRQADGRLKFRTENDQVALCVHCGGIFGDPFSGIAIKNGYFSIEHYGGSNWRWTKIITFRYHPGSNHWHLHKVGEESYHTSNPDEVETHIQSTDDFGIVQFEEYRVYGG